MPTRYVSPQPFEELDHTADAGVLVRGASAEETLARLILAFGTLLAGRTESRIDSEDVIGVDAGTLPDMAVDLLRELLFRFENDGVIPVAVTVLSFDPASGASVEAGFTRYDPETHADGLVFKAVTHHAARFEPAGPDTGGWLAQVVFDV